MLRLLKILERDGSHQMETSPAAWFTRQRVHHPSAPIPLAHGGKFLPTGAEAARPSPCHRDCSRRQVFYRCLHHFFGLSLTHGTGASLQDPSRWHPLGSVTVGVFRRIPGHAWLGTLPLGWRRCHPRIAPKAPALGELSLTMGALCHFPRRTIGHDDPP